MLNYANVKAAHTAQKNLTAGCWIKKRVIESVASFGYGRYGTCQTLTLAVNDWSTGTSRFSPLAHWDFLRRTYQGVAGRTVLCPVLTLSDWFVIVMPLSHWRPPFCCRSSVLCCSSLSVGRGFPALRTVSHMHIQSAHRCCCHSNSPCAADEMWSD